MSPHSGTRQPTEIQGPASILYGILKMNVCPVDTVKEAIPKPRSLDTGSVLGHLARVPCTWVFLVGEGLRQSQRKSQSALETGEDIYSRTHLTPGSASKFLLACFLPRPGLALLSGLFM